MTNKRLKKNVTILLLLLLIIIVPGACEKEITDSDSFELKVLFQYEYRNYAWGYSHRGWFIDNNGNIYGYNLPETWNNADSLGYIPYDSLMCNYEQADTLLGKVQLDTLILKSALIEGSIGGKLSELDCHGADMGSSSYYCYFRDTKKNRIKKQLLSLSGDCEQINTAPEAIELTEYLRQIIK